MCELESEESAKQKGVRLKILTTDQMLSRLPTSLAQLKGGNNFKNEIKQLLWSLYLSKQVTKQSITIWSTLFKNANNLGKHQK